MSEYLLYGSKMVANDNTMKDFAESIFKGVPTDDLKGLGPEEYYDTLLERVTDILDDDISRTDIDYEKLMYKYRGELGELLYEIENNGYDKGDYPVCFFGEKTQHSFNSLIYAYIRIYLIKA
jgi:hypothetical protein